MSILQEEDDDHTRAVSRHDLRDRRGCQIAARYEPSFPSPYVKLVSIYCFVCIASLDSVLRPPIPGHRARVVESMSQSFPREDERSRRPSGSS